MNKKQKQLEDLKRKYFWQQKGKEIGLTAIFIFLFCLLIFILGTMYLSFNPEGMYAETKEDGTKGYYTNVWMVGLMCILILVILIFLLSIFSYILYVSIKDWINSNWEKADKRARRDLNK